MHIKIKLLHPNAVLPTKATAGDAAFDLTAVSRRWLNENCTKMEISLGIASEIPEGYVGLIFPRSSIHKTSLRLSNCVGVIDSGYRGEWMAVFDHPPVGHDLYKEGERVAQVLFQKLPDVTLTLADELSTSERGSGGFGSTGK